MKATSLWLLELLSTRTERPKTWIYAHGFTLINFDRPISDCRHPYRVLSGFSLRRLRMTSTDSMRPQINYCQPNVAISLQCSAIVFCLSSVCRQAVVCLSVMTRVYCDKMAEVRIMEFHWNVAQCLNSLPAKCDDEILRGSPRLDGLN